MNRNVTSIVSMYQGGASLRIALFMMVTAALAAFSPLKADSEINSVEPEVRTQMLTLVQAWIDAEVQSDGEALEEILHESFLSTFASGQTLGRSAYVDFIVGLDISPFTVENESMVQHEDTVVVIDVSESGTTKFTWIAILEGDKWQVISQTFSRVEAPESE